MPKIRKLSTKNTEQVSIGVLGGIYIWKPVVDKYFKAEKAFDRQFILFLYLLSVYFCPSKSLALFLCGGGL